MARVWIEVGSSHPQPCNNFTSLVKLDWQTTVTSLGNIQTRAQRKGSCGSYSAQPLPYYAMPALLVKHSYYAQYNAASLTVLCTYKCAVCIYCASENDGAIVEPTQLRCDRPHCSILKKLNPLTKSFLVYEKGRKAELRILNLWRLTKNLHS